MDFRSVIDRLQTKLRKLAKILNDPEVSPELRRAAMASAFTTIGQLAYDKAYDMTAWDYEINQSLGRIFDPELAAGLARKLSDSVATGSSTVIDEQLPTFVGAATAAAQYEATQTAKSLGKYTILKVRLGRKKDCDWCIERARRSPIYNPTPLDFGRHNGCDCILEAEGFKSRNGEVANYRK